MTMGWEYRRWEDLSPEHREWLEAERARGKILNELYRLELAERDFPLTPETHRIVSTRPHEGNAVSITQPTHEALYFMTGPGGFWANYPPGFLPELVRRKTCPILQKGRHMPRSAAVAFVKAMQWGGRSCLEAWTIIANCDVPKHRGVAWEIMHVDDLPLERDLPLREQRRYRDAWRRSPNGGPIYVDEALKLAIDEQRKAA